MAIGFSDKILKSLTDLRLCSKFACCEQITKVTCYIGKPPATLAKPTGVSKRTVKAMEDNLKVIPSLKWQYYGNEYGTLYVYPGFSGCGLETYDPRFRYSRCSVWLNI